MPQLMVLMALMAPLVLLLFIPGCSAVYEDQVGLYDWHQAYIGRVTHAAFQTQGSGRKRVIVTTEKNVIASLVLRTGEIFWKQTMEESETTDGLEIVQGKYAVTLSRAGYLRAWHLPDGALVWETYLHDSPVPAQLHMLPIDLSNDGENDLMISKGEKIFAVSSADGRIIWSKELEMPSLAVVYMRNAIYALGSGALYVLDAVTGAINSVKDHGLHKYLNEIMVVGNHFIGLDPEGLNIIKGDVRDNSQGLEIEKISLSTLIPSAAPGARIASTVIEGVFAILTGSGVYLTEVDRESRMKVVKDLPGSSCVSEGVSIGDGVSGLGIVQHVGSKALLRVISTGSWDVVAEEMVELEAERGQVQKLFLNPYIRTDRSRGFRALVVSEDDSLALLQQGKVVWTREEALASVLETAVAELPVERAGVSVAAVEHSLAEWLRVHFLRLKSALMLATGAELAVLQNLRLNADEKTKMSRDHKGFRKLIVVLTTSGKLLALHTGDGRVVWSKLLPPLERRTGPTTLKLFPWQVPHHTLDQSPVALVLATSKDAGSRLSWVNMHTGKQEAAVQLAYTVKQAIPLPLMDSSERRLHLFVDDEGRARLFPATEESLSMFKLQMRETFYYVVNKEMGSIEGFAVSSEAGDYTFLSRKLWSVVFPSNTEMIATVASGRADEVVHTRAKVLSNRDVLFKYLNKNMIFVATVTPRDAASVGAANPEETWVVAYLIDGVTGHVLHRVTHPHSQGPVHAVLSENWVVYQYFNVRSHRVEMSVMEIYDKTADDRKVLQLMLGRYNASAPFSSFSRRVVEVKSQSYYFGSSVKAMGVTTTAKGITGKQVLVGTVGNQVIALDKRFLDPRRSLNPTPAEKEEGIVPLSEGLPVFPQSYISHAARVEGLRGVVSFPARLESTCLVFAYGTDLFFTRAAPSRTYDSLTEDFSYALLLVTMAVLTAAIFISWALSERKELMDKWR